ncbi:hypothetical protein [Mycobacterium sp. SMC-17]|uniref:hypothetical protein n=1 Tax=Mycobacterium sp. SMC-17 TaxID=3381628 RepID=UPI003875D225
MTDTTQLPPHFLGQSINEHVNLITSFSARADLFVAAALPAGGMDWPKAKATTRGMVPVPVKEYVTHVDIFLSDDGRPYWPYADRVWETRSAIGDLRNSSNWCLSAVVFDRPVERVPDPCGAFRGDVLVQRCHRVLAATAD